MASSKRQAMTTTNATTNPYPDVTAPAGADFVDDWQPQRYRIVYGQQRDVAGKVEVSTSVAQLTDGTINRSDENYDPPMVRVDHTGEFELTVEQAHELAGAILDAVNWPSCAGAPPIRPGC